MNPLDDIKAGDLVQPVNRAWGPGIVIKEFIDGRGRNCFHLYFFSAAEEIMNVGTGVQRRIWIDWFKEDLKKLS